MLTRCGRPRGSSRSRHPNDTSVKQAKPCLLHYKRAYLAIYRRVNHHKLSKLIGAGAAWRSARGGLEGGENRRNEDIKGPRDGALERAGRTNGVWMVGTGVGPARPSSIKSWKCSARAALDNVRKVAGRSVSIQSRHSICDETVTKLWNRFHGLSTNVIEPIVRIHGTVSITQA